MTAAALDAVGSRIARIDALMTSVRGGVVAPATTASRPSSAAGTSAATSATTSFAATLQDATRTRAASSTWSAVPTASATAASGSAAAAGLPYGAEIDAAAQRNGISPMLLAGLVRQESGFDPSARSPAGAVGLTQLMPATAAGLGVADPTDPAQSLEGGARYLREQLDRFGGDEAKALAAYNAGPGAVQRFGGVPPYAETQHYVEAILSSSRSTT